MNSYFLLTVIYNKSIRYNLHLHLHLNLHLHLGNLPDAFIQSDLQGVHYYYLGVLRSTIIYLFIYLHLFMMQHVLVLPHKLCNHTVML